MSSQVHSAKSATKAPLRLNKTGVMKITERIWRLCDLGIGLFVARHDANRRQSSSLWRLGHTTTHSMLEMTQWPNGTIAKSPDGQMKRWRDSSR